MSKGLEALENIKHYDSEVGLHEKDYEIIEKELDVLRIINYKEVNVYVLLKCNKAREYNDRISSGYQLTDSEFEKLREVLQ